MIRAKSFFIVLFFVIVYQLPRAAYSQNSTLLDKADVIKYRNPNEAIKIASYQLNSVEDVNKKAQIHLLIAKAYLIKGNYPKAITQVYGIADIESLNKPTLLSVYLMKSEITRILYLNDQAERYLEKSQQLSDEISAAQFMFLKIETILKAVALRTQQHQYQEAESLLNCIENNYFRKLGEYNQLGQNYYYRKGNLLFDENYKQAIYSYRRVLNVLNENKLENYFIETKLYVRLGQLFVVQKKYKNAKEILLKALNSAHEIENQVLLKTITHNLAMIALALDNPKAHQKYNTTYTILDNKVASMLQESINTIYSTIDQEQQEILKREAVKWQNYKVIAWGVFGIICLGCLVLIARFYWRKRHFIQILNYLEAYESTRPDKRRQISKVKKKSTKRVNIPKAREEAILKKIRRFENSKKFTSNDMSLAVLASHLDTNTKYLSEIIHRHYGDNFSMFINKLRVNYIINKLKMDPSYQHYKISFLAEKCGFSSHSSFATVFKSIVGMTPARFIKLLEQDQKENEV